MRIVKVLIQLLEMDPERWGTITQEYEHYGTLAYLPNTSVCIYFGSDGMLLGSSLSPKPFGWIERWYLRYALNKRYEVCAERLLVRETERIYTEAVREADSYLLEGRCA